MKMYLVYFYSIIADNTEFIAVCKTEEKAKEQCEKLGRGHFYAEIDVIE